MTIEDLKALMPPPTAPIYPGTRKEWMAFEKIAGLRFPDDYFTVINTYGSGRFLSGEFKLANPLDPDDQDFADRELKTLREGRERAPSEIPYALFPEAGGLYPFGIDGNGHTFLWLSTGQPAEWPIVFFDPGDYFETVRHSLVDFLVLLASNKIEIDRRHLGKLDVLEDELEFIPRRLRSPRRRKP